MTQNEIIRLLFSFCLIPFGAVMILVHGEGSGGTLLSHLGLAFIIAGVLSTFHEGILQRFEKGENAIAVADEVHKRLKETSLSARGIELVSPTRKGYEGYYRWANRSEPDDIFFAGRSVLHRVDAEFRAGGMANAEIYIAKRLADGAKIKVLLLDPRSELVPRLARDEGQTPERFLSDVESSLGVCIRLHQLLLGKNLPASASLDIRVFDEIPYFAYHSVGDSAIIGFYFSSILGYQSAAYQIVDPQTKEFFAGHFRSIFSRAHETYLLRITPHSRGPELNQLLISDLRARMASAIKNARDGHAVNSANT